MNTPCALIRDLIPLYHDEICSQDSRKLVEDHVAGCAYCKKYLDGFHAGPIPQEELAEQEELKDLRILWKEWKKRKLKVFWKRGLIIAALLAVLSSPIWLTLTANQPVAREYLKITDVCKTEDGSILFHLYVDDGKILERIDWETREDGSLYLIPKHPIIKTKRSTDDDLSSVYLKIYQPEKDPPHNALMDFWVMALSPITSVYVGSPEDPVLVWKHGQELPSATPAMEQLSEQWPKFSLYPEGEDFKFNWEAYNAQVKAILGDEMFERGDIP